MKKALTRLLTAGMLFRSLFFPRLQAQDTLRINLDSCLQHALEHHFSIQSAQLQREAAAASLQAAKRSFAPAISAQWGGALSFSNGESATYSNYGIEGNCTLFDGFNKLNQLQKNRIELQESELLIERGRVGAVAEIVTAYMAALTGEERLVFLLRLLNAAEEQLEEGAAHLQAGRLLESDYRLLEAEYKKTLCEVQNSEIDLEEHCATLRRLLALPEHCVPLARPFTDEECTVFEISPLDTVLKQAFSFLPDLKINELEVKMAEYDIKIAKGGFAPSITIGSYAAYFGGQLSRTDAGGLLVTNGNVSSTVSLSLIVPLYSQGQLQNRVAQGKITLQQAKLQREEKRRNLQHQVESCHRSLLQSINLYNASRAMLQATEAHLTTCQAQFKEGVISTTELLQQQERFLKAANDYVQNKYACLLARKLLEIYTGDF